MNFIEERLEMVTAAFVVVLFGSLVYIAKDPITTHLTAGDLSFEMPRPKSFWANLFGLGLDEREIDRSYINNFEKKKAEEKKKADEKAKAEAQTTATFGKSSADNKKDKQAGKKPEVSVNVVGDDRTAMTATDIEYTSGGAVVRNNVNFKKPNATTSTDDKNDSKNNMTSEQWRSLVLGQPSKENVSKMMNAYMTGDLDENSYFSISSDLLKDNKAEVQDLGLYAVSSFYAGSAFKAVASNMEHLPSEIQSKAQTYLNSYTGGRRPLLLLTILKGSSLAVVDPATQVIMKAYQMVKDGTGIASENRKSRGGSEVNVAPLAITDFQKFIPAYQELSHSSDPALASIASSALNQLQGAVALLEND